MIQASVAGKKHASIPSVQGCSSLPLVSWPPALIHLAKILIVDDDPEIRSSLKRLIELSGHQVETAPDGMTALEMLSNQSFDVMVTDIVMPDGDGLETMKEVRDRAPNMPVIAMSGGGRLRTDNYLTLAKALGARRAFQKPFDTGALVEAIEELV